jgi:pyridoxine 4-dehydrogenase
MVDAGAAGTWQLDDLTVNRMGFGAMRVPGVSRDQALAVLRQAVELGVNHVDTAAFYFSPRLSANELINSALSPYPDGLVIATKVGPGKDPGGGWRGMARPDQLRGQVEENLRQLGRDHLDLVYLRTLAVSELIGEHFAVLAELREQGLIRHLGISNVAAGHIDEATAIAPVVAVQNRYAIDSRRPEADEVLAACGERGIAFVPFFSIAGEGREDGAATDGPESVIAVVARAHGGTPAQVRLAWTLAKGPHVLGIPGTSNPDHLAENITAGQLRLTDDDLAALDAYS